MPPLVGVEAYLRMVWWKRFILVSDAMGLLTVNCLVDDW